MSKRKIITYLVKPENLKTVGDFLDDNSSEYGFSPKKGEEEYILFIDDKKRIFAIVDEGRNNVKLADYASPMMFKCMERILSSWGSA